MRTCNGCHENKPLEDFYAKHYRCKSCHCAATRERALANPEKTREYHRNWRKRNPDASRKWRLGLYGLTQESFNTLLASQSNACAICHTTEPGGRGQWHVDHDHACCPGERSCGACVRGLLCQPCNMALGLFQDDIETMTRAYRYLRGELG